tara:strand:- start:557 stop:961 length:405 start_codon:yes stop_codon:yes gene_type:complete
MLEIGVKNKMANRKKTSRWKKMLKAGEISQKRYDNLIAKSDRSAKISKIASQAEEAGHTGSRLGGDKISTEIGKKVVRTLEGDTYHPTGIKNIVRTIADSKAAMERDEKSNFKSGGKVESNLYGWPTSDARGRK